MTAQESISYFKSGETITIEAACNGFVIYSEQGNHVAGDVQQVIHHLLTTLTNHEYFAEKARQEQAAQGPVTIEAPEVDTNTEETV